MKRLLSKNEFYLFAILLAVCVTIGAINNTFFAAGNIVDLFCTATPYGIFAVGIMMVVVSGGIDISFPAIATLSTYATLLILINSKDRKSTRLNSSHITRSRMPSSA